MPIQLRVIFAGYADDVTSRSTWNHGVQVPARWRQREIDHPRQFGLTRGSSSQVRTGNQNFLCPAGSQIYGAPGQFESGNNITQSSKDRFQAICVSGNSCTKQLFPDSTNIFDIDFLNKINIKKHNLLSYFFIASELPLNSA